MNLLFGLAAMGSLACFPLDALAQRPTGQVLYIVPTLDDQAYISQLDAARKEAGKYPGIKFQFTAGASRNTAPELIAKIESAVTRGLDVIVIDPGEAGEQLTPALEKAQAQGVKVITNSVPIPTLKNAAARIQFDDRAAPRPAGEYMASKLKPGDRIAVLRCYAGNTQMDNRQDGFLDGLQGSGIKVAVTGDAFCDPLKARALMENWLTAFPDLKGLYSDTDIALIGAVEALKRANKDMLVIGHDGQAAAVKMIAAGDIIDATVIYPYWAFGETAVDTAARVLAGEKPGDVAVPIQGIITRDNAAQFLKDHPGD